MADRLTRRHMLASSGVAALGSATHLGAAPPKGAPERGAGGAGGAGGVGADGGGSFAYALNTSTVRGQKLALDAQIDLAIEAGYDGIEPWIRDIERYRDGGGSLADLARRCAGANLAVVSAIGFARWVVNDEAERAAGLEQMKRDMALVRALGGTHIAAPPVGMHRAGELDLRAAGERYHALLDLGRETGVTPQLEIWGPAKNLSRLGEALFVAAESGHPDACVLADAYHLFRGGSDPHALKLLGRGAVHCFHMNDYPRMPREQTKDGDRVYPGDGVAPLDVMLGHFAANSCRVFLSLELFNRDYWKRPAGEVARTGLAKMRAAVGAPGAGRR